MALIHEKLYQTRNLARIDLRDYLQSLVTYLFRSYGVTAEGVAMRLDVQLVRLDPNPAILCGLIVNELVSNSLKHAFPAGRSGWIAVRFRRVKRSKYLLTVSDNGVGLGTKEAPGKTKSLGLEMVGMLADQLTATLKVSRRRGTEYRVTFDTRM
jgi:two-component sensor histidine kinase